MQNKAKRWLNCRDSPDTACAAKRSTATCLQTPTLGFGVGVVVGAAEEAAGVVLGAGVEVGGDGTGFDVGGSVGGGNDLRVCKDAAPAQSAAATGMLPELETGPGEQVHAM